MEVVSDLPMSSMSQARQSFRRKPTASDGFLLPLAACAGLILVLSSLSVQAAMLHSRRLLLQQSQRQQQDDQLASAAHQIGADLLGPYDCLLKTHSALWRVGFLPANCPSDFKPDSWMDSLAQTYGVHLRVWEPVRTDGAGGLLRLQLGENGPQRTWRWSQQAGHGLREVVG